MHKIQRRTSDWISHILRRNSFLKHVIQGNIEGKRRRGIRRKQLSDDLKEKTGDTRG